MFLGIRCAFCISNLKRTLASNIPRYIKYSIVNGIGFLIVEFFSYLTIVFSVNELLGVSIAYGISFFVTFLINSLVTVRSGTSDRSHIPYSKFHLYVVSGTAANVGYILLQFALCAELGVSPLIGNMLGGIYYSYELLQDEESVEKRSGILNDNEKGVMDSSMIFER